MKTVIKEPSNRLIRVRDVMALTGIPRSSLYKLMKNGEFPKQIRFSSTRAIAWSEAEVVNWVNQKIKEAEKLRKAA